MKRLSSSHITHRCSVSVGLLIHKVLRPVRFIIKNKAFLIFHTDYKYIKYFLEIILPALVFCFVFKIHLVYQLIKLNC